MTAASASDAMASLVSGIASVPSANSRSISERSAASPPAQSRAEESPADEIVDEA